MREREYVSSGLSITQLQSACPRVRALWAGARSAYNREIHSEVKRWWQARQRETFVHIEAMAMVPTLN